MNFFFLFTVDIVYFFYLHVCITEKDSYFYSLAIF